MAYGNWGAWVFRGDEHMPQWEDQTPYREEDQLAGYQQAFMRSESNLSPHHAVLGGKEMRLCGYKSYPVLFHRLEEVDLGPYRRPTPNTWDESEFSGEIDGYRFHAEQFNGNMLDLTLVEPDGTIWTARCGYCYGAGHDDIPVDALASYRARAEHVSEGGDRDGD